MSRLLPAWKVLLMIAACAVFSAAPGAMRRATAQNNANANNDNGNNANGNNDNANNTNTNTNNTNTNTNNTNTNTNANDLSGVAGILVNPDGVLRVNMSVDRTGALMERRLEEARRSLPANLMQPTKMRKIALRRLENAVAKQLERGEDISDELRYLAGLTRIEYVFLYPEAKEIVIAGPAEGFVLDPMGRAIGMETGQAIVDLEDLVVALRAYGPNGTRANTIGCSIDPTQEGLARMQQFLKGLGGHATPAHTRRIADGLRQSLGLQEVKVLGISPKTHFAGVLVEADYRMKLIGIGLQGNPVGIKSYVERASAKSAGRNGLQRWYFVPDYNAVRMSEDGTAMRLEGRGVKLVSADEVVLADGSRASAGKADRASRGFVRDFTDRYEALARRVPVYGQLRNLIDLSIAAAFIQENDYFSQAGWNMAFFGDETAFSVERYRAPEKVDTACNAIWRGNRLMLPIGGGVTIQARQALDSENLLPDDKHEVADQYKAVQLDHLRNGQWWWD